MVRAKAPLPNGPIAEMITEATEAVTVADSIAILRRAFNHETGSEALAKEAAIFALGEALAKDSQVEALAELVRLVRPFLATLSKAKAAKLMRTLLDNYLSVGTVSDDSIALCSECVQWCRDEGRTYLRQAVQIRLIEIHLKLGKYSEALVISAPLLSELKKLDDKPLLMELQLLESRAYFYLKNYQKAKASLAGARTNATAIYCPPLLQGGLDLMSGILHAQDSDFKTAYSYFYEAFEGYDSIGHAEAARGLKYMLLSKVMLSSADEVAQVLSGKLALRYTSPSIDALRAVAKARENRSLADFEAAVASFSSDLSEDPTIIAHLESLYDSLLEHNLLRLIEPFRRVEIGHVASLINLAHDTVEAKLSQMILDKKLHGILDQGSGCLDVYDAPETDAMYDSALLTLESTSKVVDALYAKAHKLQ
jgi:26S proteasome regulatory subunit N6